MSRMSLTFAVGKFVFIYLSREGREEDEGPPSQTSRSSREFNLSISVSHAFQKIFPMPRRTPDQCAIESNQFPPCETASPCPPATSPDAPRTPRASAHRRC